MRRWRWGLGVEGENPIGAQAKQSSSGTITLVMVRKVSTPNTTLLSITLLPIVWYLVAYCAICANELVNFCIL